MFDQFDSGQGLRYLLIGAVVIFIVLLNFFFIRDYISSNSEVINDYALRDADIHKTREAAVAGLFYPADYYQLAQKVDGYLQTTPPRLGKRPHIIIVPHAGYIYSAQTAALAYRHLLPFAKKIKKVILLGPAHRVPVNGTALSTADSFKTPLGAVPVNQKINARLAALPGFDYNDKAHQDEHSLEVQLPFLQKSLKKFSIVPIVYGQTNPQDLAAALRPLLQRDDTLLVISADLSHYLDDDTARLLDTSTAQMVEAGEPIDPHQSCGATGINAAMLLARQEGLKPQLLGMRNSGEQTGDKDSVVGYAAWMFAKPEKAAKRLSPLEQEVENLQNFARHNKDNLLQIAKRALALAVEKKHYQPDRSDYPDVLFDKGAAFVTLTKDGELRGCIGSLLPNRAIALDLADNTFAAANEDSRFPPVAPDEPARIKISISLMTGYEQIRFDSEENLLEQIVPGVDGLVLRDGDRQGLLLPSVWRQLPDKQDFLNSLKIKAGLSPSYRSPKVKIYRFRTVEITEDEA